MGQMNRSQKVDADAVLTTKERAVKRLLTVGGLTRREVAEVLRLTTQAVGDTVNRIHRKTGWTDQA